MPFTRYDLKGFCFFCLCALLCLAEVSGVYAMGHLLSGLITSLSGICKGYFWVCTKGE